MKIKKIDKSVYITRDKVYCDWTICPVTDCKYHPSKAKYIALGKFGWLFKLSRWLLKGKLYEVHKFAYYTGTDKCRIAVDAEKDEDVEYDS